MWTEWGKLEHDNYQNYEGYTYQDSSYSDPSSYDYYEDAIVTSECTCEHLTVGVATPEYELQLRKRDFIKEGTIGGKFCRDTSSEVRKCGCERAR